MNWFENFYLVEKFQVIFQKWVWVFHRVSKCEKHLKPWGCRPSGFIVFERLETWWNTKHEFLNLLLQQRKLVKLSFELVFSIQLLYLRREVCMILKKMCMMCMILSPNCCDNFEYSTTEVTLPSFFLSVLSEHVASQSKWQSADSDLVKLAKKRKSVWPALFWGNVCIQSDKISNVIAIVGRKCTPRLKVNQNRLPPLSENLNLEKEWPFLFWVLQELFRYIQR